jgi:hypothetical protein
MSEVGAAAFTGNVTAGGTVEANAPELTNRATTTASKALSLVREVNDAGATNTKDSAVDFMLSRQQAVANNLPYTRLDIRLSGENEDSSNPSVDVLSLLYDGKVGIGDTAPGTALQITGTDPFLTLKNSETGNADGGCDSKIIFEDHSNAALGLIEVSHNGAGDNTLGNMFLQTSNGSALVTALELNSSQNATFAADVNVTDTGKFLAGTGGDLKLYNDGTDAYIDNYTGGINVRNFVADSHIQFHADNGTGGGNIAEYFRIDGDNGVNSFFRNARFADNVKASFGAGDDLKIYHDGSHSYVENNLGNLTIFNKQDDGDVILATDNMQGGTNNYLVLDGSDFVSRFETPTEVQGFTFSRTGCVVTNTNATVTHTADTKIKVGMHISGAGIATGAFVASLNGGSNDSFQMSKAATSGDGSSSVTLTFSNPGKLTLSTANTELTVGDIIGRIDFQAPKEASGTDAILVGATIHAEVQETFASDNNSTALVFSTGTSTSPIERMRISQDGHVGIGTSTSQRKFEVYSSSSGSVIDTHIGGTYATTNYQGLTFGYAEKANTLYRHSALVFERDDSGVGDATGNVHILNSVAGSGTTSADLSDAKLSLLKTGSAILAGIPFFSDTSTNSMYTHDVSATDSSASGNTAYGFSSLAAITGGDFNTAIGHNAGLAINSGSNNTLLGYASGDALTTGIDNVVIGYAALSLEDTGSKNTAIGKSALNSLKFGGNGYNVAVGFQTGKLITTGIRNTLVGSLCGNDITLGTDNVALGYAALSAANAGSRSVAIGVDALQVQTPQFTDATCDTNHTSNTTTVTCDANSSIKVGMRVTGTGIDTGETVTITAVNASSVTSFTISHAAVSTNTNTTLTFTGGVNSNNTAVGYKAGSGITTGTTNTLIGAQAGDALTSGTNNVAVGYLALSAQTVFGQNTAVGVGALQKQNVSGHGNNTAVGLHAGKEITTGTNNTIMGTTAGDALTEGQNNIIIGSGSAASAVDVDNEITLGDANISAFRCADQSIAALSDGRDKTDIKNSSYGLEFINTIRPVEFTWNFRPENMAEAKQGKKRIGFIAQELQEAMPNSENEILDLVYNVSDERIEAKYGNLIPILVKAVQELSEEVKALKNK